MAMHPVGPLPAATYWLRRGVLAVAVLLVLLLLRSCTGGGSPRPVALPTSPSPSPSRSAATVPVAPSPTPSLPVRAAPTVSPSATTAGICRDSSLSLISSTDQPSYTVGSSPSLTLVVRNTGAVSCRRDLGSSVVELRVLSGTDRIWSSDDCTPGRGSDVRTLAPGASRSVQLTWSGKRSQPGCAGDRTQAKAGTYTLVARVGSLRRAGATFTFR